MIKKILWPQLMPPRAPKNVLPKIYNLLSVLRQIQQVMIEVSRLRLEIHQKYLKTLIVLLGALFPYLSLLKIPRPPQKTLNLEALEMHRGKTLKRVRKHLFWRLAKRNNLGQK
jgi:hypothetical protein